MIVKAQHNQTMLDVALQHTGSVETIFDILQANPGVELCDQPHEGMSIEIPEHAIAAGNSLVKNYYVDNHEVPASAIEYENDELQFIGDMEGYIADDEGYI